MSAKRDRTSAEREARASERAKARAGSYHTRPENHANDFEKVYRGSRGSVLTYLFNNEFVKGEGCLCLMKILKVELFKVF